MRKKGVGRAQRVRAVDRDTRALQGKRCEKRVSIAFVCALKRSEW
jgi:hypothetical protein